MIGIPAGGVQSPPQPWKKCESIRAIPGTDYAIGINPHAANGGLIPLTARGREYVECRFGDSDVSVEGSSASDDAGDVGKPAPTVSKELGGTGAVKAGQPLPIGMIAIGIGVAVGGLAGALLAVRALR